MNWELMIITEKNLVAGKNEILLNVENLKPGLYLLKITTSSGTNTRKIMKQ